MYKYHCLNNISKVINNVFDENYEPVEEPEKADAILVRSAKMHDMEFGDELLAISRAGTGVNNIPLDRCAENGIVVFNAPGANANSVKELVLASLINASRNIPDAIKWVRDNYDNDNIAKDMEKAKKAYVGKELLGKKLGVIGLGAIGGMVANACDKLGMDVMGIDPFLSVNNALMLSRKVKVVKTYDEIYKKCDYIYVQVHLTDKTRGMIGADAFSKMKRGAILLNFSRGEVVDNAALKDAIDSGKLGKYVTDFPDPEVVKMKNVIATPHLGASTGEAEENCAKMAAEEIRDYLENGNITHSVNLPDCDAGICEADSRISIIHENKPNMLTQFTQVMGDNDVNIAHLTNKSKDEYAYCVFDTDSDVTDKMVDKLNAIDGVIRVRVIK